MARPAEGLVERGKLLEQKLILLQRRDRFRAARADIHAIAHEFPPLKAQREPKAFRPKLPSVLQYIVTEWADPVASAASIDREFPRALASRSSARGNQMRLTLSLAT